jgi:prepilin-type N-terminal cleavage/methylation domain-containing protein
MRVRAERGESLIEIIIAIVIMGIVFGAFFSAVITTSSASTALKNLVVADALLRDSAELTKSAVRHDCTVGTTYSVLF